MWTRWLVCVMKWSEQSGFFQEVHMFKHLAIFGLLTVLMLFQPLVHLGAEANDKISTIGGVSQPPYRVLQVVLRRNVQVFAYDLVDTAKASGYNAIQFTLAGGVKLDNAPWKPNNKDWSKAELLDWVAYVRSRGLEVIPGFHLLTHQEKFTEGRYPKLMFNAVTYDPRNEEVYRLILPLLDEIITAVRPVAIHIGHDEVKWTPKHLKAGEVPLPSDLFLKDVLRIHAHLKSKGVSTWMWGDMLLSPKEFPRMSKKGLQGGMSGYGKEMRDRLPRDIVIVDWQYSGVGENSFSLSVLQKEGFKVIAATGKNLSAARDFAKYAIKNEAYGLMATTWGYYKNGYTEGVKQTIKSSGELFRNPDAKVKGVADAGD